jgi:sec-independent protein translocase protein TatC
LSLITNLKNLKPHQQQEGDAGIGGLIDNPASAMEHLLELRKRLINSIIAIVIATVAAASLSERVLDLLAAPIGGVDQLQIIQVTEGVSVWFRVSLTVGVVLASPAVIAQVWIFLAGGLRPNEQRLFYLLFPFAVFLFITGVVFTYVMMLPVAVPFLTSFLGITAQPTIDDYISFVTKVLLYVGASFEMPLVFFVLARMGMVNAQMLVKNWRFAIVGIAIMSAVVTPTPDPINMGIVSAPLVLLYFLSIIMALIGRRKSD